MQSIITLVLAALLGVGLAGDRLRDELVARLRREVGSSGALDVTVEPAAEPRGLGSLGRVSASVDQVDARQLPLAALVPVPQPRGLVGRIDSIELAATRVALDTLHASEVRFEAADIRYDLVRALGSGELRVTGLGQQRLTVGLRDGDLDEHALHAYPELQNTRITFESGRVVARASVAVIFAAFPIEISGTLAVEDGRRVLLQDAEIKTGRLELSDELRASILERLDPLIDLEETFDFPVPLRWESVAISDGRAEVTGVLETPAVPRVEPRFQPRERYLR
ncbi:MAG: hypothetical protein HUU35_04905 [Armatimonadetes bacterium]|nr:hypothetical protein [Armatimonadota bacterium]